MHTLLKILLAGGVAMTAMSMCSTESPTPQATASKPIPSEAAHTKAPVTSTEEPAAQAPTQDIPKEPEKPKVSKEDAEKALAGLKKTVDKMEGITWYYHPTTAQGSARNHFYLYFGRGKDGKLFPLRLYTMYYADDWLFVSSAWAKADDDEVKFPQRGDNLFGWERDNGGGDIWEWSDAPVVSDSDWMSVEKIANVTCPHPPYQRFGRSPG